MTYENFISALCEKLTEQLPDGASIQLQKIYKNNGLVLDGLIICDGRSNVSPTIFLNHYYQKRDCFPDFDAIWKDILYTYEHNRSPESVDLGFFTEYDRVKDHLALRVISFEQNRELLGTVPYVHYLDLAIVFFCLLDVSELGSATILINSQHLEMWNVTAEQLLEQTMFNTPRLLPYEFRNMSAFLNEMFRDGTGTETDAKPSGGQTPVRPMYVLTNNHKLYGAGCMLYPDLLRNISNRLGSDLYVLPCSIHELIVLPADSRRQSKLLLEMVADINATELSPEEILSNSIYYYSRSDAALCLCV